MKRISGTLLTFALVFSIASPGLGAERASCPDDIPRAPYTDVYPLSTHAFDIDCLHWRNVISDGPEFFPTANLARWEMAQWLDTAIRWTQSRYGNQPSTFLDTANVPSRESIEALRQVGVTKGATVDLFDPHGAIPRWQMALFITRSIEAAGSQIPDAAVAPFADIDGETLEAQRAIAQLAATGITRGTSATTFSPASPVTKEQMASFVARMLEYIWVLDVGAGACDISSTPKVCTESKSAVVTGALNLRVALFMADHVGSITEAVAVFEDPTTRVDFLVDGSPVPSTRWVRTHNGAVYAYWQTTLTDRAPGQIEVVAQIRVLGVHAVDRVTTVTLE